MPTPSAAVTRSRWRLLLVAAITLAIVWWFLRSLDFAGVWRAILNAHRHELVIMLGLTVLTYIVRAWRWQVLLRPIGRARFRSAFRTTVIGFTATFLLPGRIGEVLRPYLLARAEGFEPAATLATVVVERILDLIIVLLLFSWFLLTTSMDVGTTLKYGGAMSGALGVAGFLALVIGAGHPERLGRWAGRLTRLLPGRASSIAERLVRTFVEGLAIMRRPGALLAAFSLSVVLWLVLAAGIWVTSLAFDLTFPFSGTFLIMMFLVVGVAVPTPGGIGSFQLMYQYALTRFFGASDDASGAAALVLWALSICPVAIAGLIFMAQDGLTLGGVQRFRQKGDLG